MKTVTFTAEIDGLPITPEAVVFSNIDGDFGFQTNLSEIIAAVDTPLTFNVDRWEYTFDETDFAGIEGTYWIKMTYDGEDYYVTKTLTINVTSGQYTNSLRLAERFGQDNIDYWTRYSDSETSAELAERIQRAIDDAEDEIDTRLRGGCYSIPFSTPIPVLIAAAATVLAGCRLYENRGAIEIDEVTGRPLHKFESDKRRSYRLLAAIRSGRIRLDLESEDVLHPYAIADLVDE